MKIDLMVGDITKIDVDAIVNAAHPSLQGGGGVDGAIHAAAGVGLLEACLSYPVLGIMDGGYRTKIRCKPGDVKLTDGFNLPCRYVLHTPGPIYDVDDVDGCRELLESCYEKSLRLAYDYSCSSISYPAISTGIYGYPLELATRIAVGVLCRNAVYDMVVKLVCYDESTYDVYSMVLDEYGLSYT